MYTKDKILQILKDDFQIKHIELKDETHKHSKHPEAQKFGGKHFALTIVANDFDGKTLINKHKMIHQALESMFPKEIHALKIKALNLEEWKETTT